MKKPNTRKLMITFHWCLLIGYFFFIPAVVVQTGIDEQWRSFQNSSGFAESYPIFWIVWIVGNISACAVIGGTIDFFRWLFSD